MLLHSQRRRHAGGLPGDVAARHHQDGALDGAVGAHAAPGDQQVVQPARGEDAVGDAVALAFLVAQAGKLLFKLGISRFIRFRGMDIHGIIVAPNLIFENSALDEILPA